MLGSPPPALCGRVLRASSQILPWLEDKFVSVSYRVPTMIVSSADLVVKLARPAARQDVVRAFQEAEENQIYPVISNCNNEI